MSASKCEQKLTDGHLNKTRYEKKKLRIYIQGNSKNGPKFQSAPNIATEVISVFSMISQWCMCNDNWRNISTTRFSLCLLRNASKSSPMVTWTKQDMKKETSNLCPGWLQKRSKVVPKCSEHRPRSDLSVQYAISVMRCAISHFGLLECTKCLIYISNRCIRGASMRSRLASIEWDNRRRIHRMG